MLQNKQTRAGYAWLRALLAMVLVLSLLSACGGKDKDKEKTAKGDDTNANKVVATYKGGEVKLSQFESFLGADKFFNYSPYYAQFEANPTFREDMLKQYIAYKVLTKSATDKQKQDAQKKAQEQMDQIEQSLKKDEKSKENIDKFLKDLKIDNNDLKQYMELRFLMIEHFNKMFKDDKVKAEYDKQIAKNKNAYIDTATVSHILVALKDKNDKPLRTKEQALKRAKDIKAELNNGGDFAKLAKKYTDDEGSKETGGKYDKANIDQWVEPFKKAALSLPLNTISDPVETDFGYHIMKVEWRESNKYEDVKEKVRNQLASDYFSNYMQKEIPKIVKKIDLPKVKQPDKAKTEDNAKTEDSAKK